MERVSDVGRFSQRAGSSDLAGLAISIFLTAAAIAKPARHAGFTPPETSRDCQPDLIRGKNPKFGLMRKRI